LPSTGHHVLKKVTKFAGALFASMLGTKGTLGSLFMLILSIVVILGALMAAQQYQRLAESGAFMPAQTRGAKSQISGGGSRSLSKSGSQVFKSLVRKSTESEASRKSSGRPTVTGGAALGDLQRQQRVVDLFQKTKGGQASSEPVDGRDSAQGKGWGAMKSAAKGRNLQRARSSPGFEAEVEKPKSSFKPRRTVCQPSYADRRSRGSSEQEPQRSSERRTSVLEDVVAAAANLADNMFVPLPGLMESDGADSTSSSSSLSEEEIEEIEEPPPQYRRSIAFEEPKRSPLRNSLSGSWAKLKTGMKGKKRVTIKRGSIDEATLLPKAGPGTKAPSSSTGEIAGDTGSPPV